MGKNEGVRPNPNPAQFTTLILKGGGVKGLAFAGALKVLQQNKYDFQTYVGTSAGSIASVFLAAGVNADELAQMLLHVDFSHFLDASPPRALWNLVVNGGLYPANTLQEWLEMRLRSRFDQKQFPTICMRDLQVRGKRVIVFASHARLGTIAFDSSEHGEYRDMEVSHAVRLSCSIPGLFIPGMVGNSRVYDGGLLNNFPLEAFVRLEPGADPESILGMYLENSGAKTKRWWLREVASIVIKRDDVIRVKHNHERTIVIDTNPIETTDFRLGANEKEYLLLRGQLAAEAFLHLPTDATRSRIAELRPKVDAARTKRSRATRAKAYGMLVTAMAILLYFYATAGSSGIVVDPAWSYQGTYLTSEDVAAPLGKNASEELELLQSEAAFARKPQFMSFSHALQLVLVEAGADGSFGRATKIVIYDGEYSTKARCIEVEGSDHGGSGLVIEPYLFGRTGDEWTLSPGIQWSVEDYGRELSKRRVDPSMTFDPGDPMRLVVVAEYEGVLTEPVEPIILDAHRSLDADGVASYLVMADDPSIHIEHHLFLAPSGTPLRRLHVPASRTDRAYVERRIADWRTFLCCPKVKGALSPKSKEAVERVMQVVDAKGGAQAGGLMQRFAINVESKDALSLRQNLPPNDDHLRFVVFVSRT